MNDKEKDIDEPKTDSSYYMSFDSEVRKKITDKKGRMKRMLEDILTILKNHSSKSIIDFSKIPENTDIFIYFTEPELYLFKKKLLAYFGDEELE